SVSGMVTFNGQIPLSISLGAFDPLDDGSQKFTIVDNNDTDLVTFDDSNAFTVNSLILCEGSHFNVGLQEFTISYEGGDGNDVVLTAVPEPASAVSFCGGLALL